MKLLKNIVLCLFVAVSAVGVSSVAHAEDPGRIALKPIDGINLVLERVKAAQDLIASGAKPNEVVAAVKSAKDASKEINANDKVDIARIRANVHLAKAIGMAKEQDLEKASEHLKEASDAFAALKGLL